MRNTFDISFPNFVDTESLAETVWFPCPSLQSGHVFGCFFKVLDLAMTFPKIYSDVLSGTIAMGMGGGGGRRVEMLLAWGLQFFQTWIVFGCFFSSLYVGARNADEIFVSEETV